MEKQNYKNHARFVPLYHYFTFLGLTAVFVGSIVNLVKSCNNENGLVHYSAALICALSFLSFFVLFFSRFFALKAQDRVIRLEESLRVLQLTGKPMDSKLTMRQIIGLRFASDAEYADLAKKAVEENLSEKQIKQSVKDWKADYYRV